MTSADNPAQELRVFEPIAKASLAHRAITEVSAWAGASVVAFTITPAEVSLTFMAITAMIGVVVWLVRLEGRINTQQELLARVETNQKDHGHALVEVKETIAKIAGHMGVQQ